MVDKKSGDVEKFLSNFPDDELFDIVVTSPDILIDTELYHLYLSKKVIRFFMQSDNHLIVKVVNNSNMSNAIRSSND